MKIFVSGGAGFIGSHLCKMLLEAGHSVTAYDNLHLGKEEFLKDCKKYGNFRFVKEDLLQLDTVKRVMKGHDLVFHMAANSDISEGAKYTDIDLKLGTVVTYNVLEAMRTEGVKQLIFASTSAVYGEAQVKPTPESYGPLFPISLYGASKLACEGLCSAFSNNYGIQVWMYRFANIVGPHSTHGAIHDFVKRLKKNPSELTVLGNGTQRKSYLHVNDCIQGMWFGYEKSKKDFQCFNLASEGVTQVKLISEAVVEEMKSHTGVSAKIIYGTEDRGWVGDVAYTHLDGSLLHKLGWKPQKNSDESMRQAVRDVIAELGEVV